MDDTSRVEEMIKGSPLAAIFPGKTIALATGKTVTVRKWTAKEIVHEVPAIIGRILGTIRLNAIGADKTEVIGIMMTAAAPEILNLVAFTTRLPKEEIENLSADDFVMLTREVLEQNESFFGELAKLVTFATTRVLPGT